ncbi:TPA: hypothetical protein NJ480_004494 [Vibrio parahaemolyticus]|nr:hypothetical protein [Vibrio parahaemolyticus]
MATVAASPFPQLPEFFSFFVTSPYGIVISLFLGLVVSGAVLKGLVDSVRGKQK